MPFMGLMTVREHEQKTRDIVALAKDSNANVRAENERLTGDNASLRSQITGMRDTLNARRDELATLRAENEKLKPLADARLRKMARDVETKRERRRKEREGAPAPKRVSVRRQRAMDKAGVV